jgi:protein-disulfide isomerase
MKGEIKFILGIIAVTGLIIAGAMYLGTRPEKTFADSEILLPTTHITGNKDAKIVLVEFSDFQCPACGAYKPVVDQLLEKYSDKILFGYRHFPLPQHENAFASAIASEAANEQGKFWEMNDYLFDNQTNLTEGTIRKGAEKLQLDLKKFDEDIKNPQLNAIVEKDKGDGNTLRVNSTPTFYLNGKKLQLNRPQDLLLAIEQAIK